MGTDTRYHNGTGADAHGSNQTEKKRTFRCFSSVPLNISLLSPVAGNRRHCAPLRSPVWQQSCQLTANNTVEYEGDAAAAAATTAAASTRSALLQQQQQPAPPISLSLPLSHKHTRTHAGPVLTYQSKETIFSLRKVLCCVLKLRSVVSFHTTAVWVK